jgi:hypothetical protein
MGNPRALPLARAAQDMVFRFKRMDASSADPGKGPKEDALGNPKWYYFLFIPQLLVAAFLGYHIEHWPNAEMSPEHSLICYGTLALPFFIQMLRNAFRDTRAALKFALIVANGFLLWLNLVAGMFLGTALERMISPGS